MRKLLAILEFIDALNDWVGRVLSFGILLMFLLVLSEVIPATSSMLPLCGVQNSPS